MKGGTKRFLATCFLLLSFAAWREYDELLLRFVSYQGTYMFKTAAPVGSATATLLKRWDWGADETIEFYCQDPVVGTAPVFLGEIEDRKNRALRGVSWSGDGSVVVAQYDGWTENDVGKSPVGYDFQTHQSVCGAKMVALLAKRGGKRVPVLSDASQFFKQAYRPLPWEPQQYSQLNRR